MNDERWYTTAEAAAQFDVDRRTVLRWAKAGSIASKQTLGGHFRISEAEVRRLLGQGSGDVEGTSVSGPHIVLIDDDRAHSRAIKRLVRTVAPQVEVTAAPDGFAGGLLVARLRPSALFLDLDMPGLSGLEVAARLREDEELADLPVVIITGAAWTPPRERLDALGILRVVRKPVTRAQLRDLLDEVLLDS